MTMVLFLPVLFSVFAAVSGQPLPFSPADNYLINSGALTTVDMPDGRIFRSDPQAATLLSTDDQLQVSVPTAAVPSPVYFNARIFTRQSTYTFHVSKPGWHWVRLYFFPVENSEFDLTRAVFDVTTDNIVLVHSLKIDNATEWVFREFLVNVTSEKLSVHFSPMRNSVAFVNGIEFVSAPDKLISDRASTVFPVGDFTGVSTHALQTVYRLNVGGPVITSVNDTLGRSWGSDWKYLQVKSSAKSVRVSPDVIVYPEGVSPLIAPNWVYASANQMGRAGVKTPRFNITWNFDVVPAFSYLIRMHFCDIVSKSLNDLYFNVYINGNMAISGLDLSSINNGLVVPYYRDFVVNASIASDRIVVQVGPMNEDTGSVNAILNGLEIMKISNSVGSLDGEFSVSASRTVLKSKSRGAAAAVGLAMAFGAFVGLGAMVVKWSKRPQDWEKRHSFSSWLLPLHTGHSSFMTSKSSYKSGYGNFYSSTLGLGRYFTLAELQEATKNFDEKAVIGVGGFGNVYLGDLEDGTKVAVKRGNPQSEQGITEFQTEIQMLSKLRHRHLVSLIGYCDENSEMILVYEYMANGPFRDHLYGKDLPALSWKQRLEICIGAARGLHYLHTGAAQGIIHRDVKTTNILLDENLIAKVSDFGLSKAAPSMEQTHVSTAVKGSFGYLDPEYFRRQQLTDKSDVYSFGVVLLEALCARPAINPALPREQVNLAEWAMQWKKKGLIEKIVDSVIAGTINTESLKKFTEAAEKCLLEYGVDRPSMGDVLWNLEYALQLQEASSQGQSEEDKGCIGNPPENSISSPQNDDSPAAVGVQGKDASSSSSSSLEHSGAAVANELFAQHAGLNGR